MTSTLRRNYRHVSVTILDSFSCIQAYQCKGNANQDALKNAAKDTMTEQDCNRDLEVFWSAMRRNVEDCLSSCKADVIMASSESVLTTVAMGAGYPIASVPLGFANYNGRAFGMELVARNGEEDKLLKVMRAWEATFPDARKAPPLLVEYDGKAKF